MVMRLLESAPMSASRTGGQILVANLLRQGVDLAFCVPGESYLAVLDALYAAYCFRWPGWKRFSRSRSVSGNRLSAHVWKHRQMGGRDRLRGAHSGIRRPRVPGGDSGAARSGGAGAARGRAL